MTNLSLQLMVPGFSPFLPTEKWLSFLWVNTWRTTAIMLFAFGLSVIWQRASAAARHLIWVSAFCSLLALPVLSLIIPSWRLPSSLTSQAGAAPIIITQNSTVTGPGVRTAYTLHPTISKVERAHRNPVAAFPSYVFQLVLAIWALGFAVVLGRLVLGSARVWRMVTRAKPLIDGAWENLLQNVAGELGLKRPVMLARCDGATMPMAWGIVRPMILLPGDADQWSAERRRVVIAHELAHIHRQDCLTQLLAQLGCSVYWFHPLLWLAARKLRQEAERACDDRVLELGTTPSSYAEHLLELARSLRAPQASWAAAVAMANPSQLEGRMVAMLDPRRNRDTVTPRRALLTSLLFVALILPLAALRGSPASETGRLMGTVRDPSGSVVAGAVVTLTNLETHTQQTMISGSTGGYKFTAIPAGKYFVEFSKPGFTLEPLYLAVPSGKELARGGGMTIENGQINVKSMPDMAVSAEVVAKGHRKNRATPTGRPKRILMGSIAQAAKLLTRVQPVYPQTAIDQGLEGTVMIDAVISREGNILSAHLMRDTDPALANAALEAVKQWHYRPTTVNGEPIEVETTITVRFRLEE